jgi:cell division septation protein DedD
LSRYTFSPGEYGNATGTWYCEEKKPQKPVFIVTEPQVAIRVWDLDSGTDVSGTTIPVTANITYRIETNIDTALQLKHRPDLTPADSFWTVRLTDPTGRGLSNIYTGSYGAASTQILSFDSAPLVASSPYDWRSGSAWNRASRNAQGGLIYPLGTYTFTVSQNLNGMEAVYKSAGITETGGKLSHSTQVTFVAEPVVTSTPAVSPPPKTPQPGETAPTTQPAQTTPVETTHPALEPEPPVPERTTYAPLPGWIVLASLLVAGAYVAYRPR